MPGDRCRTRTCTFNARVAIFLLGKAMIRCCVKLVLILWASSCFVLPLRAQPANRTQARIEKKTYEFKEASKEMEYALFVPSKYDKTKKTPLMIALHGL